MATQGLRGTPQYGAPEIFRGYPYTELVDTYPIGLILFEVCSGHRVFSTPEEAKQGSRGIPQLYYSPPEIIGPPMSDLASSYATSVIANRFGPINATVRRLLRIFWDAVKDMKLTDQRLFDEVYWGRNLRVEEINRFVRVMSDDDPNCRPSMESVAHHFRANLIRSLLEYDSV